MKIYKTAYTHIVAHPIAPQDDQKWYCQYFADPQDALNYLVSKGVDKAAETTADEVRQYTTNGSSMQIFSSVQHDPILAVDEGSDAYYIMGEIKIVEVK